MVAANISEHTSSRNDVHGSEILKNNDKTSAQARRNVVDGKRVYLRLYSHSIGMQRKGKELRQQIERSKIPVVHEVKKISKKRAEDLFSRLHEQAVKKKFQAEIAVATAQVKNGSDSTRKIDADAASKLYDRLYSTPKLDSPKAHDSSQDSESEVLRTIDENSAKQLYDRLYSETQKQDNIKMEKKQDKTLVIDERDAQQLFERLYSEKMGKSKVSPKD